jgi:transcriptional regulator with XRE-family HTH domain
MAAKKQGSAVKAKGRALAECFGENLKRLRQMRGFTQTQLAERCGLSQGFLQSLEAGRRWMGPDTIARLAEELDVTQSELFHDCELEVKPDPVTLLRWLGHSLNVKLPEEFWTRVRVDNRF